ncbi:hypothetical protein HK105_203896 [Polyrhizophydium stewartii]|uniref:Ribosomal protein S6 n=1 Tax=Polyrhizophydium stewartii TaxID=2732419 RepID=A0ABR4NAA8_9FUNG|nr:hypothetical protein HK105_002335 [Polyrhizophydium stewartii]
MPAYELVLIARAASAISTSEAAQFKALHKTLLKSCATHVLDSNGVVRQFSFLGWKPLPYRMKRHQEIFTHGSYYTMLFDSSPETMSSLSKSLALNESVVRHTIINCGDSLKAVTSFTPPERL